MQPTKLISGQPVSFTLKDAVCPNLTETIRAIGPELQLTGSIVFLSDGCDQKGHFAVVEVTGLRNPCAQLDGLQPGLMAAVLGRDAAGHLVRKAGVMAVVVAGGEVRPGDPIRVELPAGERRPLVPV